MKKKIFWILAALAALFCLLTVSAGAASGSCGKNLTWVVVDRVLTIGGSGDMDNYASEESVPWCYYDNNDWIKEIIIGDDVTSIGDYAFFNCDIDRLTIGKNVRSFSLTSFSSKCTPRDVYYTGDVAGWCSIDFGGSDCFGDNLYIGEKPVTEVVIPDSVTEIGSYAFYNCNSLTRVVIPDSVTKIGSHTFDGCTNLTDISIGDGVTWIGYKAFGGCSKLTEITIPMGVTTLGEAVFEGCTSLEKITLPKDIWGAKTRSRFGNIFGYQTKETTLMYGSYQPNWTVDGVVLYPGVKYPSIDDAYTSGSELPVGTVYQNYNYTSTSKTQFSYSYGECYSHRFYVYYNIPESLKIVAITNDTKIDECAFYNCNNLVSVIIPSSVTSIDESAFAYCDKLTDIYYTGTEEQWKAILIADGNTSLTNATIHYNYSPAPSVDAEISLKNGLAPSFTIDTEKLTGTDNYAVITVGGKTERVEQADWADGTVSYGGLAAKELAQTVTMGVYDASDKLLAEKSISVAEALKEQIATETDAKAITKIEAMLHYGAAAQQYFGTNTENLADDGIRAMADVSSYRKDDSSLQGADTSLVYGTSCVLGSRLQMKIYFTTNDKTVFINGNEVNLTASPTEGYYYYIMDVAPENIFKNVSIEVKNGDTVLATASDSIASCCARLYALGGEKNETMADALLNYGLAFKA